MPIPESHARQVAYHGNERNSTAAAAQLRFGVARFGWGK
jgi:hypothetical protein